MEIPTNENDDDLDNVTRAMLEELSLPNVPKKRAGNFSERMISAANLLVTTHRLHLDHDHIDKMVVLRMNKRFMEGVRRKEAFTSIILR